MITAICIIIGTLIGTIIGNYIGNLILKFHNWIKIRKIEKVHLPKSLLDRLEKPTVIDREFCFRHNFSPVGILHLSDGLGVIILKYLISTVRTEREYRLDLIDSDKIIQVTTHAWENEFWRDEDLKEHIAELMEKYKEKQSSSINNTSCSNQSSSTIYRNITMNTTIQKINTIIDNFDKEYGEWMDKKDHSLEEEMEIFKKAYNEFCDLYSEDNVTDKLIDLIVNWIQDTVGEMYLDWNTEIQDYYNPGLTLKDFVEKYTKGE